MGPCMCGDPYCGSCGNPSQAAYADWLDSVMDMIDEVSPDESEAKVIQAALEDAIKTIKAKRST